MAAFMRGIAKVLCGLSPSILHPFQQYQRLRVCPSLFVTLCQRRSLCQAASLQDGDATQDTDVLSRYKDRPWVYLESQEYVERYGTDPVWVGYRRNHKGGIPPQKTRKTCIRGDKICGNPCPICRDQNIVIHHQNVKLLQQFISPHTGMVYESTRTGVCVKQQKKLNDVINKARDHGLLSFQIPYVEYSGEDYSNFHDAVGCTPPPTSLTSGDTWYKWYSEITPDEDQVAKVKKTYKAFLK
ncbi:28S ribosomal protein S18b, mitochondrial [Betta splendens]|uniref:Small ribosomal subunit protein mS40 n=1 Tax=Betta splendens TaxID=158456 RepID=A0A6P7NVN8_BETSP|nr:28S ribosomal protein S18b, mitochondrial [Betta splendens]